MVNNKNKCNNHMETSVVTQLSATPMVPSASGTSTCERSSPPINFTKQNAEASPTQPMVDT